MALGGRDGGWAAAERPVIDSGDARVVVREFKSKLRLRNQGGF